MGIVKQVNFEILTREFCRALNKHYEALEEPTVVDITIDTKGKIRTLRFYTVDTSTGKRTIMYKTQYEVATAADFFKKDVNYLLYRELFYNCFAFYAANMENIMKQREAEQAVDDLVPDDTKVVK